MAQDLSEKDLLKMEVEQLKKEVKNTRIPVSKAGKEIKEYVEAQAGNDPFIKGIPEDKNPFKEKGAFSLTPCFCSKTHITFNALLLLLGRASWLELAWSRTP
uniref:Guanine nucleotide-binding protein subunit gamma n=1 Tax=Aotus nancymaae TaxID=37293 RepID=A0A2K5C8V7_AOTNA